MTKIWAVGVAGVSAAAVLSWQACSSVPMHDKTIEARSNLSSHLKILEKDLASSLESEQLARPRSALAVSFGNLDYLQSRVSPQEEGTALARGSLLGLGLVTAEEARQSLTLLRDRLRTHEEFLGKDKQTQGVELSLEKLEALTSTLKSEFSDWRDSKALTGAENDESTEWRRVSLAAAEDFTGTKAANGARVSDPLFGVQSPLVLLTSKGGRISVTLECDKTRPTVALTLVDLRNGDVLASDQGKAERAQVIGRVDDASLIGVRMEASDLSPWEALACKATLMYPGRASVIAAPWGADSKRRAATLLAEYLKLKREAEDEIKRLSLAGSDGVRPEALSYFFDFLQNRYNRLAKVHRYAETELASMSDGDAEDVKFGASLSALEHERLKLLYQARSKAYQGLLSTAGKLNQQELKLAKLFAPMEGDEKEAEPAPTPSSSPSPGVTPPKKKKGSKAPKAAAAPKK